MHKKASLIIHIFLRVGMINSSYINQSVRRVKCKSVIIENGFYKWTVIINI